MSPCSVSLYRFESKYGHLCCFGIQKHQNSASMQLLEMHSQRKNSFLRRYVTSLPLFGSLKCTMKYFLFQYCGGERTGEGEGGKGETERKKREKLLPLINDVIFKSSRALKFFSF